MTQSNSTQTEKYRHYKTQKLYEIIGLARHSETHEEMVVYKALYQCEEFGEDQIWVRPKDMFFEHILYNGEHIPRFQSVNDE